MSRGTLESEHEEYGKRAEEILNQLSASNLTASEFDKSHTFA